MAPLSMGFRRQEYWSGLPFPSPGDVPDPEIEPMFPALHPYSFTTEPPEKPQCGLNNGNLFFHSLRGWMAVIFISSEPFLLELQISPFLCVLTWLFFCVHPSSVVVFYVFQFLLIKTSVTVVLVSSKGPHFIFITLKAFSPNTLTS